MRRILKYIISLIAVFMAITSFSVSGQGKLYLPTQVKFGTDLTYIGISTLSNNRTQFEVNADIDFYRFYLVSDFGVSDYRLENNNFNYSNSGNYFRAGFDYNFLKTDLDEYSIYMGARYVHSSFAEDFEFSVVDPVYGDYTERISNIQRTSFWIEVVAGMKVRVWNNLFLGWTGRFKFINSVNSEPTSFANYWIPAYGKAINDTAWGLNYQIFYRIPLRKRGIGELEKINESTVE